MNRPYTFWLAAIIGVLVGVYLYFRQTPSKIEGFEGEEAQPATECPAGNFVENMSVIPYQDKMKFYLSSFSTGVSDKSRAPYCSSQLRWFDLNDPTVYFNVNTVSPPSDIVGKGMPMKNVILVGPPSDFLAESETSYDLPPFTMFLCASMKTPDFSSTSEIILFRVYAETPNSVRLLLKPSDMPNRTMIELVLGADRYRYQWDISTNTLLSNGIPTLYALTIDTDPTSQDKTAIFYIGNTKYTAEVNIPQAIKLGNSRIEINSNGNLDAMLYSAGFIGQKLTDGEIARLGTYMTNQQAGGERKAAQTKMEEEAKTSKIVSELEEKLGQCHTEVPEASTNQVAPVKKDKNRWMIRLMELNEKTAAAPAAAPAASSTSAADVSDDFTVKDTTVYENTTNPRAKK